MFDLIKPGHILRFGTDPHSIGAPMAATNSTTNDNRLETLWTSANSVGAVELISHPSGPLQAIADDAAKELREGFDLSRSVSYSPVGHAVTASDRRLGSTACDYVGYADGKSYYTETDQAVFSKEFSGCLMVAYRQNGVRRIAHVSASQVPTMDCKQAFLDTLRTHDATLIGWFRPFVLADSERKAKAFRKISKHADGDFGRTTTFGVFTASDQHYAIDAFRPNRGGPNVWVVMGVYRPQLYTTFNVP
ncbi:hypothetical protein ACQ86G_27050 [Roseateles chitinivorans]|uniref:hypothetical protein n=1 Tax=Roseateles chitinivorans TaxID=2917965 RepID=UPI003D667871